MTCRDLFKHLQHLSFQYLVNTSISMGPDYTGKFEWIKESKNATIEGI